MSNKNEYISVCHLQKSFQDNQQQELQVLDDINFEVKKVSSSVLSEEAAVVKAHCFGHWQVSIQIMKEK